MQTYTRGVVVGLITGCVLGAVVGTVVLSQAQSWRDDVAHDLNQQYQSEYTTRNQIQFFDMQKRPDTSIPFNSYGPSSGTRNPCD